MERKVTIDRIKAAGGGRICVIARKVSGLVGLAPDRGLRLLQALHQGNHGADEARLALPRQDVRLRRREQFLGLGDVVLGQGERPGQDV